MLAPTIIGTTANQATNDQTTITPFINVAIADDAGQTETVTVTLSNPTNGTLTNLGIDGSYDAATGIYTDTGSYAAVTSDLNGLVFTPTEGVLGQSVTTTFTITDTNTASATTTDTTTSVIVTPGPAITGTVADQGVTNETAIMPFSGVVVTDHADQSETVTVTLSSAADGALSQLGDGSYDAATGVYTATGTAAAVTTDLEGLVFTPAPGVPGQAVTTTFTISDTDTASLTTADNLTSVVATAGPALTGTTATQTVTDGTTITPFAGVAIADSAGQTETLTVTLSTPANGTLSNLGAGTYYATAGLYTDTGSAAAVTADLQGLVFTPAAGVPGQGVTTTFTISDTDAASLSVLDGTTTVDAIAGPAITGIVTSQTAADATTITPFAGAAIADAAGQIETVTVTLSAVANGVLTRLGNFSDGSRTGVYIDVGTAALVSADLKALVFTPAAGVPGHGVVTTFTITDTDTASLAIPASAISLNAIAGPAITGTTASHAVTDRTTVTPFTGVTITDDASQAETVHVTLSAAANGTLSHLGNGSYDAATGVYTDTGSAAAVTSDLRGLVFTPTADQVAPGHTVTTTFTIADTDTATATASDTTTSVVSTAAAHNFALLDTTTGLPTTIPGQVYNGPVAGLAWQCIDISPDNLNITASVPNSFLRSGSGMDALNVSLVNGNNVLDGSTGSNFLTGGTGDDTFFMDDRNPTAPVFSTVVNFHAGDNVTVWGVNPTDFTMVQLNNQGAAGFTGLDLIFTAPGHIDVSFVLATYSTADLTNGRLTSTYGTTPDLPGLPGSQFLTIHGN